MKVDYADREFAPNGGVLPEEFAAYLEKLCNLRAAEGYRLIAVLPGNVSDLGISGAWLFFDEGDLSGRLSVSLEAAEVMPPGPFPPPTAS